VTPLTPYFYAHQDDSGHTGDRATPCTHGCRWVFDAAHPPQSGPKAKTVPSRATHERNEWNEGKRVSGYPNLLEKMCGMTQPIGYARQNRMNSQWVRRVCSCRPTVDRCTLTARWPAIAGVKEPQDGGARCGLVRVTFWTPEFLWPRVLKRQSRGRPNPVLSVKAFFNYRYKTWITGRRNSGSHPKQYVMVCGRYFSSHGDLFAGDQPRVRGGVVGGAAWAGGDQRRAAAGAAGDTMDARGLDGPGEGQRRWMAVRRRARMDCPTPGGARIGTLASKRLYPPYPNMQRSMTCQPMGLLSRRRGQHG
jgi:hypothetical protein